MRSIKKPRLRSFVDDFLKNNDEKQKDNAAAAAVILVVVVVAVTRYAVMPRNIFIKPIKEKIFIMCAVSVGKRSSYVSTKKETKHNLKGY